MEPDSELTNRVERIRATRITRGEPAQAFDESVIREDTLEICINGEPAAVQWRTPGHDRELALGFCVTTGLLSFDDAANCDVPADLTESPTLPGALRINVNTPSPPTPTGRLITIDQALEHIAPLGPGITVSRETIWAMHRTLVDNQHIWSATGGAHAAGLFLPHGAPVVMREDVGRHNALDKVIGHALLHGVSLPGCALALSSRASFEMALKAARAGLCVVACVSAATSTAVRLCQSLNITIAGFVRKDRMVVYTHPQRITG